MNRRRFLSLLGLAAPALALDPERALWVPGEKTIFDLGAPARGIELADHVEVAFDWTEYGGHGGNSLVSPDWVMKMVTERLVKDLRFASLINRDYSDQFEIEGAKVGTTVRARLPVRYMGRVDAE